MPERLPARKVARIIEALAYQGIIKILGPHADHAFSHFAAAGSEKQRGGGYPHAESRRDFTATGGTTFQISQQRAMHHLDLYDGLTLTHKIRIAQTTGQFTPRTLRQAENHDQRPTRLDCAHQACLQVQSIRQ